MVKMGVREEEGFDLVAIGFEVLNIWDHIVDTWIIIVGEEDAHVDDDYFVAVFDDGHILTDAHFAEATLRYDANCVSVGTGGFELGWRDLLALVAVVTRLVDWNADDVLSSADVDILADHALGADHFATTSLDREVDFALFGVGLFDFFFFVAGFDIFDFSIAHSHKFSASGVFVRVVSHNSPNILLIKFRTWLVAIKNK